jgi:hypothetical protein
VNRSRKSGIENPLFILDFTVQVKLKKVFLGFNLAESSIPNGITRLGKPFDALPFKGDVNIVQPVVFHL